MHLEVRKFSTSYLSPKWKVIYVNILLKCFLGKVLQNIGDTEALITSSNVPSRKSTDIPWDKKDQCLSK